MGKDLRASTSKPHVEPEVFACYLWAGFRGSQPQGIARKDLEARTLSPTSAEVVWHSLASGVSLFGSLS